MDVHIGEAIERRRVELGMTKTAFAGRIGRDRSNIYDIIEAPSLDTMLLRKVSEVLQFNFFRMLADAYDQEHVVPLVGEPQAAYGKAASGKMRLVIEMDSNDATAQAAAVRMARAMQEGGLPAPERDKQGE